MGFFALCILWVTALLVAWAALMDARELHGRRRALVRRGVVRGEVARGDGDGGALAVHEVAQVGRALDGPTPTIGFWDRSYASRVAGGAVRTPAGELVEIAAVDDARAEVWVTADLRARGAAAADAPAFDDAHKAAARARGFTRTVRAALLAGDAVWISGGADGILVSAVDPLAWLSRGALLCVAFAAVELCAAAACTALAVSTPAFGPLAVVGGVLGLAHFLGVQPLAVAVRNSVRTPDRAALTGEWRRPAAEAEPARGGDELATRPS